jgi:hypothetical protein
MFKYAFNAKNDDRIWRLSGYIAIGVYFFKFKKWPYYLDHEMFKTTKLTRQVIYTGIAIFVFDIATDLALIIYKTKNI